MRVNGNLRGLAWAASGGAVYSPTQATAVPGARGGGSGGSAYYVPDLPPTPVPAAAPQIRPVALGPAARPPAATSLPGVVLGPAASAPAAVVTAPVTDGTVQSLLPTPAPVSAPVFPLGLLAALFFGSQ